MFLITLDGALFVFSVFLERFNRYSKPIVDKEIPVLMDNYISDITIKLFELIKKLHITKFTFPPHTSDELQPLGRSCYGMFRSYYDASCDV